MVANRTQERQATLGEHWGKQNRTFRGENKTEPEDYPTEVQRERGRRQSWKRSAGKTWSKNQERNAPGTRAEESVEDWHRTLRKVEIISTY